MFNLFSTGAKLYQNLSGKEFKEKFLASSQAELIDVRTPGEFRSGTIKGARNIDFLSPGFRQEFLKLPKDKEYFLFCRSGNRSGQACAMLAKEGYKVYNLSGGIGEWPV
jgi:rhodanese-related sulfurtransferase